MGSLDLFTVAVGGAEPPPAAWLAVLDEEERQRAQRLRRPADRRVFVAAHALKRLALAEALAVAEPTALRFAAGPHGKPSLPTDPDLHFSLSHTHGLAALALGRSGPLGVDAEAIDPALDTDDLARSLFTDAEIAGLARDSDRVRGFYRLWTAKEAVLKAEGLGLSLPLAEVTIDDTHARGPSGGWRLWRHEPSPRHLLTLAWAGTRTLLVSRHALDADPLLTLWAQRASHA